MKDGSLSKACVFLSVLLLSGSVLGCASTVLLQPPSGHSGSANPAADTETIAITNDGGKEIGGLLTSVAGDYGTVMVSGGNAMGMGQTHRYASFLHLHGFRVLAFSFQGYDSNGGDADLGSLLGDARAFHEYLRRRFPGQPVVYLASSISTAPALCLPSHAPELGGVILEGTIDLKTIPFVKVRQIWQFWPLAPITLPYATFVSASIPGELDAARCARSAGKVPALFLHHPKDRMTPYGSARSLYEAYAGPKHFEVFGTRNRQYHLLLSRDSGAQAVVLKAIASWLQPDSLTAR